MKCLYREKIYRCGDYLEVEVFPVFKKANGGRRAKYKPTSEMQARLNQRHAEQELTRIVNENFARYDLAVTLTYVNKWLPDNKDDAMKDARNFLRRVKRLRKKKGLPEMKYVLIPGGGRFHFHIFMTGGISAEEFTELWWMGYCNAKVLVNNENGLEGLAKYTANQFSEDLYEGDDLLSEFDLDEETGELTEREGNKVRKKGARRYICSKNIIRPVAEVRDGEITASKVEELATYDSKSRAAFEKLYPGYCFSDCQPYYNSENGGYYLQVKMYRSDASFLQTMKKFKTRRTPHPSA